MAVDIPSLTLLFGGDSKEDYNRGSGLLKVVREEISGIPLLVNIMDLSTGR